MRDFQFDLKKAFFKSRLGIPEHRRFAILEAALELIQQDGFEHLQFGDLAKKCKMSRTLVHHYFRNKYELSISLLDLSTLLLQRYVGDTLSNEEDKSRHFEMYCKATMDWAAECPRETTGLMLFIYISSHNLEMRKRNDELSSLGRQKIKTLIAQAGDKYQNIDAKADLIQTILTGCFLRLVTEHLSLAESQRLRSQCLNNCKLIAFSK